MRRPENPLEVQIEAAFDHRGDVTVRLKDGQEVSGFLFNRDFAPHPSLRSRPFVELFLPDGGRRNLPIETIEAVTLSGQDPAAPPPA